MKTTWLSASASSTRAAGSRRDESERPSRYLRDELSTLAPRGLLVFGGEARWVVERLGELQYSRTDSGYLRGILELDGRELDVFALPHPSAWGGGWARGQAQLVADLLASPAARR